MSRPLEKDYGAKQTTITLPFELWEELKKENINVSEECSKYLSKMVKDPVFKKKHTQKRKFEDKINHINPKFVKSMKKRIQEDSNTAHQWQRMMLKNHDIKLKIKDLINWAFDTWETENV